MDRRVKKEILIGNLNVKNKQKNRLDLKIGGKSPSTILKEHIEKCQYDIMGMQEITKGFFKKINIKSYKVVEFYRLGNFFTLPKKIDYNEGNIILTTQKIIKKEKHYLPFFPSIPRIVTSALLEMNKEEVFVLNVHLERKHQFIQKRQLEKLEKLIKNYKNTHPVILMGDFNMSIYNQNFKKFIDNLESIGLKRVKINEKTQVARKNAIDHIFVPTTWSILEQGLINDEKINQITDHFGIYVKVKLD